MCTGILIFIGSVTCGEGNYKTVIMCYVGEGSGEEKIKKKRHKICEQPVVMTASMDRQYCDPFTISIKSAVVRFTRRNLMIFHQAFSHTH